MTMAVDSPELAQRLARKWVEPLSLPSCPDSFCPLQPLHFALRDFWADRRRAHAEAEDLYNFILQEERAAQDELETTKETPA